MAEVCALGTSSDLMFVPHMLLAFTGAVAIMIFLDLAPARRCCCVLGAAWGGALAGIWLGRRMVDSGSLSSQAGLSVDRLTAALNIYLHGVLQKLAAGDLLHVLALAWLVCSLTVILWLVRRHIVSRDTFGDMQGPARRLLTIVLFLAISSVGCVASIIVMGVQGLADFKDYAWSMHYQYPLFFGSIFGLALLGGLHCVASPRPSVALLRPGLFDPWPFWFHWECCWADQRRVYRWLAIVRRWWTRSTRSPQNMD